MSGGHVTDHQLSINPVHGVHGGPRLISITSAYGLDFTCKLRLTPFGIICPSPARFSPYDAVTVHNRLSGSLEVFLATHSVISGSYE